MSRRDNTIYALSLNQPYADLVRFGIKTIETRNWHTNIRGKVLICSTKRWDKKTKETVELYKNIHRDPESEYIEPLLPPDYKPELGKALALVDLIDCRPMTEQDRLYAAFHSGMELNSFSFILEDIQRLPEPLSIKGGRKFFRVDLQALMHEQDSSGRTIVHASEEPFDVMIMRPSIWGNPFSHLSKKASTVKVGTAQDAVIQYRRWLLGQAHKTLYPRRRELILQRIGELEGKVLGCCCKSLQSPDAPCHGTVLLELLEAHITRRDEAYQAHQAHVHARKSESSETPASPQQLRLF